MPRVNRALAGAVLALAALLPLHGYAEDDWMGITFVSDTVGNNTNRLCMGVPAHMRPSDIGCPSYAPSLTTGGHVSITGNVSANKFIGDGSGLTGVAAATGDRIVSGSTGGTRMVAISDTGYISITQAGANTGWFDPMRGLVTLGVSATGAISGTRGYFRDGLGVASAEPLYLLEAGGPLASRAAYPVLYLHETDQPLDNRVWRLSTAGGKLALQAQNDANTQVGNAFAFERNGHVVTRAEFFTNGTPRMVISETGQVGIGRVAPLARLDVLGSISASDAIQVGGSSLDCGAGIAGALRYHGNNIQYCNGTSWTTLGSAGGGLADRIVSGTTSIIAHQDRSLTFTTAGSQRMVIGENGSVGIGTSAPIYSGGWRTLTIQGTNGGVIELVSSTGGLFGRLFSSDVDVHLQNHVSGSLVFATNASERMRINALGRIGVGTINPNARLDVAGTISATDAIQVGSSALTCGAGIPGAIRYQGTSLQYCNGTTWTTLGAAGGGLADRIVSGTTNIIAHQDRSLTFTTANQQRMVVGENGWVGIGTAHPEAGLELAGNQTQAGRLFTSVYNNGTSAPGIIGRKARGTQASPLQTQEGDYLFAFGGRGYHSGGAWSSATRSSIFIRADEDYTPTQQGAYIIFETTARGTLTASEKMRIASDGKVGIGNQSPAATLQVSGSFIVSTSAQNLSPSLYVGTNGRIGVRTTTPDAWVHLVAPNTGITPQLMFTREGYTRSFIMRYSSNLAGRDVLLMGPASGASVVIDEDNRIGIGTSGPVAKLDVVGTISATDAIQVGTSTLTCGAGLPGAIRYQGTTLQYCNGTTWTTLGTAGAATAASSTGAVQFNAGGSLGGDTDTFFWDNANKRLGVGVSSPLSGTLHISGTQNTHSLYVESARGNGASTPIFTYSSNETTPLAASWGLRIVNRGTTDHNKIRMGFSSHDTDGTEFLGAEITSVFTSHAPAGAATADLIFGTRNGTYAADNFERVRIKSDGKVGIGTQSPTATLHVSGSFPTVMVESANQNNYVHLLNSAGHSSGLMFSTSTSTQGYFRYNSSEGGYQFYAGGGTAQHLMMSILDNGRVGIGLNVPGGNLSVSGTISATNAIQVGTSSLTCGAGIAGAMRYNAGALELCNGSAWGPLAGGGALGDRITSGTLAVVANSATGVVSLSTAGTTWGYLSSGNSYLPTLVSGRVSATTISNTRIGFSGSNVGNLTGPGGHFIASGTAAVRIFDDGSLRMATGANNRIWIAADGAVAVGGNPLGEGLFTVRNNQGGAIGRIILDANVSSGYNSSIVQTNTGLEFTALSNGRGFTFNTGSPATRKVTILPNGNVGIGESAPSHILHISGQGRSTNSAWATSSDRRVKEDIHTITGGLAAIEKLRPVTFRYTKVYQNGNKALDGVRRGFIAQEVEDVLPNAVKRDVEKVGNREIRDFRVLGNDDFVPLLVSAVKELKAANDNTEQKLRAEIDELRRELRVLKQARE